MEKVKLPWKEFFRKKQAEWLEDVPSENVGELLQDARACHRLPKWRNEVLDGDWGAPFTDPGFDLAVEKWERYVLKYWSLDTTERQHQWLILTPEERQYLMKEWGIDIPIS